MENKKWGTLSLILFTLNFVLGGIAYWLDSYYLISDLEDICISMLHGCPRVLFQAITSIDSWAVGLLILNLVASMIVLIYISIKCIKTETNIQKNTDKKLAKLFLFCLILSVVASLIGLVIESNCFSGIQTKISAGYSGESEQNQSSFNYCQPLSIMMIFMGIVAILSTIFFIVLGYWMSIRLTKQ